MKLFYEDSRGAKRVKIGEWPLTITADDITNAEYDFKSNVFTIDLWNHSELKQILNADSHPEEYTPVLSVRMVPGRFIPLLLCYHHDTDFKAPAFKRFFCKLSGKETASLASIVIRGMAKGAQEALEAQYHNPVKVMAFFGEGLEEFIAEIRAAQEMDAQAIHEKYGIDIGNGPDFTAFGDGKFQVNPNYKS